MIKSLDRKSIEDIIALTPMQEGMLFHYLENPEGSQYVVQLCLEISGHIDVRCFEKAWNLTAADNQVLRTLFRWEKVEEPVQVVLKEPRIRPRYHDLHEGSKTGAQIRAEVNALETADRDAESLLQDVPFRVTLCKTGAKKYVLIITYHHILFDGWSNGILLKEFSRAYELLTNGKEPVRRFKTGFKEFVNRTRNHDRAKEEKYWKEYLGGCDTQSELSIKHKSSRRVKGAAVYHHHRFCFTPVEKSRLEAFVRDLRITLASLCCGAWGILLQKYNNSDDVIFGTTLSGRSVGIRGIEEMVGLFINTLPLRAQHCPGESSARFLHKIDKNLQAMETHTAASLADIKTYLQIHNNEELFDSIVVMENYPLDRALSAVTGVDSYRVTETTHYDLTVGITLFEEVEVRFIYREGVFDPAAVVNLSRHFRKIILGIRDNPHGKVSDLEIVTGEEKRRILFEFNNTDAHYPEDKTVHRLFEEQVRRTPDAAAVNRTYRTYRTYITYRRLSRESGRVANHLHDRGIRPGAVVGIMTARSVEMIIGILGILKAGAAYLPIDPAYPGERITYMLKDSGVKVLVSEASEVSKVSEVSEEIEVIMIDKVIKDFRIPAAHPAHLTHPTHPAYIIYTSGSTGKPRGVVIEHRSLVNFLYSMNRDYGGGFGPGDHCLSLTRITFDVSVGEIFLSLTFGACLVLVPDNRTADPVELARLMIEQAVTWAYIPPGLLQEVCGNLKMQGAAVALNKLLVGVEPIKDGVLGAYLEINPGMVIVNGYGPTEAAICAATYLYKSRPPRGNNVPIGTPLANTKVLLVDKQAALVPVGVPGELWISGPGLARGYLNNPELTAEKFNRSYKSYRTYIFYKTGDLARWLPGGNIEFLGRIDRQVKIRGFRIELGEIENQLLGYNGIEQAVVIAGEDETGDKYLCAYVYPPLSSSSVSMGLRDYLSAKLPRYMIPDYFMQVETIPVTPSGKVDREALPRPGLEAVREGTYTAPRDETERKLAALWAGVLKIGKEQLGIDSNFFEIGGHSLKATILLNRIHKALQVRIPLTEMFHNPTIRGLSAYIKPVAKEQYAAVEPAAPAEYYPLTSAQKRNFILWQMEKENINYNMSEAVILEGRLDINRFETTFRELTRRHESFRTSFEIVDGEPLQKIHDEVGFNIRYRGAGRGVRDAEDIKAYIHDFVRPFDLARAPILRVGLVSLEEPKHLLIFDMHHIIADGTSVGILINDFMALYGGRDLAPLRIQVKDFAQWQRKRERGEVLKQQEAYWLKEFPAEPPPLHMPLDFKRPPRQSFEGRVLPFEIGSEAAAALKEMAAAEEVTLFMLLLAIVNVWLWKISGSETIVVGSPVAGRRHADLEGVIGQFVNTLALKNAPTGEKTFKHFLKEVAQKTLEAYENQEFPFEHLVEKVVEGRDPGRQPIFDVLFALHNMDISEITIPGLNLTVFGYDPDIAQFELYLAAYEKDDRLAFKAGYCTRLYKQETIENFIQYFREIIETVIHDNGIRLKEIELSHHLLEPDANLLREADSDFEF